MVVRFSNAGGSPDAKAKVSGTGEYSSLCKSDPEVGWTRQGGPSTLGQAVREERAS